MELEQLLQEARDAKVKADHANLVLAEANRQVRLKLKDGASTGSEITDYHLCHPDASEQLLQKLMTLIYMLGRCAEENVLLLHDLRTTHALSSHAIDRHEFIPFVGRLKTPARMTFNAREPIDCFTLPILWLNDSEKLENGYRFDPLKLGSVATGIYFLNCGQHRERLVNDDLGNPCKESCRLYLIVGAARILDVCKRNDCFYDWKLGSEERNARVRKQAFDLRRAMEQTEATRSK